eukprot:scaffold7181_cov146-Amphora_coffeaeformis.AAC.4
MIQAGLPAGLAPSTLRDMAVLVAPGHGSETNGKKIRVHDKAANHRLQNNSVLLVLPPFTKKCPAK